MKRTDPLDKGDPRQKVKSVVARVPKAMPAEDAPADRTDTTPPAPRLISGQPWTGSSVWGRMHYELLTCITPDRQSVIDALGASWRQHPQSAPPELVQLYLVNLVRKAPDKRGGKRTFSQASMENGYVQLIELVIADGGSDDHAVGAVSEATGTPFETVSDYWQRRPL